MRIGLVERAEQDLHEVGLAEPGAREHHGPTAEERSDGEVDRNAWLQHLKVFGLRTDPLVASRVDVLAEREEADLGGCVVVGWAGLGDVAQHVVGEPGDL